MDQSSMNHFHGLFGIEKLPVYLSAPLCIVGSVGIINAINMIDGVDGLSSGFRMLACASFGALFVAAPVLTADQHWGYAYALWVNLRVASEPLSQIS